MELEQSDVHKKREEASSRKVEPDSLPRKLDNLYETDVMLQQEQNGAFVVRKQPKKGNPEWLYGSDSPGREFWPKCGPFFKKKK